jgi:hypothetical protein
MARTKEAAKAPVEQHTVDECLAKAIAEGDIVNFRFLFVSYSPLRDDSTEDITTPKYAYLTRGDTGGKLYDEALQAVQGAHVKEHVQVQLKKNGPAQLPASLVTLLGDNAVRLGRFKAAAQAYELLRIRGRMQKSYLDQADASLDQGDVKTAVHGYQIAMGLDYDYAAFPEPMPAPPNYQSRAQMLHAEYPRQPEDAVALQAPEDHINIALGYLLLNPEFSGRLESRPFEQRLAFAVELIHAIDPKWDTFVARYKDACRLVEKIGTRLQQQGEALGRGGLAEEIEAQQQENDPAEIPEILLGRALNGGEWWQYVKELAYEHPAAVLFVVRQFVNKDLEIIMPRYVKESPLVQSLDMVLDDV